jgi:nucleotide-binding universal stress UspA family protein
MYKIVLGIDGSEGAAGAVAWCAELAPKLDAEVIAVHVVTDSTEVPSPEELDEWCAPLYAAGVAVRQVSGPEAPPQDVLQQVATQEGADLIVIGASRQGKLSRWLRASVLEDLSSGACKPVVIVPIPAPAPASG